ncbi:MAG: GGDEF domain-containing protein [Thermomicrobiales bacterium]
MLSPSSLAPPDMPVLVGAPPPWVARLLALRRRSRSVQIAAYALAALALLLDLHTGPAVPLGSLYLIPLLLAISASRSRWHAHVFAISLAVVAIVGREVSLDGSTVHDRDVVTVALRLLTNLLVYNLVALMLQTLLRAVTALEGYALALEQARDHAWQLALTDALTGLGNRRLFAARLAEQLGHGAATVLLLDVDGLKTINDRWGHAAGDAAIARVGAVLRRAVGPGDLAARLGGDEFAILLSGDQPEEAAGMARRVRELLAAAREPGDPWPSLGVSIGTDTIARPTVDSATDGLLAAEALLAAADRALYRAKAQRQGVR